MWGSGHFLIYHVIIKNQDNVLLITHKKRSNIIKSRAKKINIFSESGCLFSERVPAVNPMFDEQVPVVSGNAD